MSDSLVRVLIHAVFGTTKRIPMLDREMEEVVRAAVARQFTRLGCPLLAFGAGDDHVHVLFRLRSHISIEDMMRAIKSASTVAAHQAGWHELAWQAGYGAFSVDPDFPDPVLAYVREQRQRHATNDLVENWERTSTSSNQTLE